MTQPHRIHTASLTLDFRHSSEAERFERDAPHWVQQQLLPLIDTLFDQFSPPHQVWVIDHLRLSLGALPASDLPSSLLAALKRQLAQALRAQLPSDLARPHSHHGTDAAAIQVLDGPAAQWRQLQFFLQHGVMPWHYPGRQGWQQADHHWLADAVRQHRTELNRLLNASARPAHLITRLVSQLPINALNGWLEQLTPAHQDIALRCLAAQPEANTMPAALRARLHRHWHQRIHQALRQRRLRQELLPVWATLIGDQRTRFLLALYACGQQPEVVRGIAQAVDDHTFDDLLRLLAPQAQPFIQQVLRHPAWFHHPDDAAPTDPSAPQDQRLREFTLAYLLVQRGSQFNKQRYMAGLIGRMAAHHNRERTEVLQTLYLQLAAWSGDPALKSPLLSLLTILWGEMASPHHRLPVIRPGTQPLRREPVNRESAEPWEATTADTAIHTRQQQWADALQQADEAALNRIWDQCTPALLLMLRPVLTACGQQSTVRQRWVVRFSTPTHYRLLTLLEPVNAPFIRGLLEDVRASQPMIVARSAHAPGEPLLTHSLWSLTFGYLLAERGSEFNRQSYLDALLRQLAAHHNLSRQALIDALLQHLHHAPADNAVRRALLTLLTRLRESSPPMPPPSPSLQPEPQPQPSATTPYHIDADLPLTEQPLLDDACYHYLYDVLVHGDPTRRFTPPDQVQAVWRATTSSTGYDLHRCLQRLLTHNPLLLQRWLAVSTHHPASWLRLCAALCPSQAAQLLAQLIALRQPSTNLRSLSATLDNVTHRLTVPQRQAFCGQMIDTLAANRTPDWLALRDAVSQSAPPSVDAPRQLVRTTTPDAPMPPVMDDDAALTLLNRIAEQVSATLAAGDIAALSAALARLLPSQPEAVRQLLLPALRSPALLEPWVGALSDRLHIALLLLLRRTDFLTLYPYGRFIANLCHRHPAYHGALQQLENLLWRALYHRLFSASSPADIAAFISDYLGRQAADWQQRSHQPSPSAFYRFLLEQAQAERSPTTRTLADRLQRLITAAGWHQDRPPVAAIADTGHPPEHDIAAERDIAAAALPEQPNLADTATDAPPPALVPNSVVPAVIDWQGDETLSTDEPLLVTNAGLVLTAPWIPRLLTKLALVQDGTFPQPDARYQAIHCLQYLVVRGQNCAEYQLALNKLLCGLPLNAPLPFTPSPDEAARNTLDTLLDALLQHWNALGHTSVDGLRQTFLQREGTLWRQADSWKLEVVPGPFDMLLDRLSWGYSTIKYPWMDRPLHVVWR
ncbi:contractile injection system tape measure protein [Dickeya undicola]|uniref:Uncharacterized protein n=1 Tax=Dickeya undicola TaxID=1577887 RepID=A0A3N0FXM7_9GAMM|nr:contractile injection system tape measure protein [Dickeya undicola]RNM04648.1 hypothetical protein EF878_14625 [Dickeya undicola]